jgi:hypothetical protein
MNQITPQMRVLVAIEQWTDARAFLRCLLVIPSFGSPDPSPPAAPGN